MTKKHEVRFEAHKPVREEVEVAFTKTNGTPVSFEAHKTVKEPVEVDFMARNK
jgi:hypothetical protein